MNNIICIKCHTDTGIILWNGSSFCNHCFKEIMQYAKEQGFELDIFIKYILEDRQDRK